MQKNPLSKKSLIARHLDYLRAFRAAYTRDRSEYTLQPVSIYDFSVLLYSGDHRFFFLQAGHPFPIFYDKVISVFVELLSNAKVIELLN